MFLLIGLVLVTPLVLSQQGGGASIPVTYTYEECNYLFDNQLELYEEALDKATKAFGIYMLLIGGIFIISVGYILILLGMTIQKIRYLGFKKWWKQIFN